jgi:hypothetical protein
MSRKKYRIPSQESVTYGIPAEEIAMICEVSFRTACRWKSGHSAMPPTARMLLCGDLGCIDQRWAGWRLQKGLLVSPEGWEISVNMIMGVPLMRQQIAAYQAEERKLKDMPAQPESDTWPEWVFEKLA